MHESSLISLERPTQAVILAGGRGTRMKPLTDTRPKAMVEIHGKPFLEYLVEMLRDQGFQRILLLLGYLPEVIQDYFGNGNRWGVDITYAVSAVEDETSRRMKLAQAKLDPCFLLMYCDNYWPLRMEKMWPWFASSNLPAMITVYDNKDGYTTNSVHVDDKGYVTVYDKTCSSPGLQGVEISYAFITKPIVESLSDDNVPFEAAVYPALAAKRQLLGYVSGHRYYSIGSHRRIPLTEAFFSDRPTIILDRDGVLNRKPERAHYVRKWEEFEWLSGAKEALRLFHEAGYRVIVVSNQAGVAKGVMSETELHEIHDQMNREVALAGGHIERIYYCPHDWEEGCECRKPNPGMLFQAQRDFNLNLPRTYFIGDDERDAEAAEAAGCPSVLIAGEGGLLAVARKLLNNKLSA